MLIGAAATIADYNGVEKASHIRDKLVEMTHLNETIYGTGVASSYQADAMKSGVYLNDDMLANVCKHHVTKLPYEIGRLAQDLAGGLMVTMPSEQELNSPEVGELIRKYLKGRPEIPTEDRMRVLRLIENMTLGRNAVGYLTESMHGAGSPQAQRIQIARAMQIEFKKSLAKTLAGIAPESSEEPASTSPMTRQSTWRACSSPVGDPETRKYICGRGFSPDSTQWQHLNPSTHPRKSLFATPARGRWTIASRRPRRRSSPPVARNCARRSLSWWASGLDARCAVMRRFADALEAHRDAIVAALAIDTGRQVIAAGELAAAARNVRRWCERAPGIIRTEEFPSKMMPTLRVGHQLVPYPLVGVISPWNFPLALSLIDAVPALIAGCAVIIKPSEVTPRFAEPLRKAIRSVPELAKVFDILAGGRDTGAQLIAKVDAICFTGSVATGRKVGVAAAEHFIPAFLELGGKDPAIVLASADLDKASDGILRSSCLATRPGLPRHRARVRARVGPRPLRGPAGREVEARPARSTRTSTRARSAP